MSEMRNTLVDRETAPEGKNIDGHQKRVEIERLSVSKRYRVVLATYRTLRPFHEGFDKRFWNRFVALIVAIFTAVTRGRDSDEVNRFRREQDCYNCAACLEINLTARAELPHADVDSRRTPEVRSRQGLRRVSLTT
jgi:hypothetical protein